MLSIMEFQNLKMTNICLQITSSPKSATTPDSVATHVIKLFTESNPEAHVHQEHGPLKGLSLNKEKLYQYQLWKAYIEGSNWNFSRKDNTEIGN